MGGGPRPGLATGRARGAPLRVGPQGSGPSAPAPCPSAVEDAGLWERWLTGRKPGGASWLVPETGGAAGTPRTRGRKGEGRSLGPPEPGRSGWRRDPLPEARGAVIGGTAACGSRGPPGLSRDAALTPPRGCRSAARTFPAGPGPEEHDFPAPLSPLAQSGQGRFRGDRRRAGAEDEGPTAEGRA